MPERATSRPSGVSMEEIRDQPPVQTKGATRSLRVSCCRLPYRSASVEAKTVKRDLAIGGFILAMRRKSLLNSGLQNNC